MGGITLVALVLQTAAFRGSFFGDNLFTQEVAVRRRLDDVLAGVRSKLEITPPLHRRWNQVVARPRTIEPSSQRCEPSQ
jgi:hypothetical protein